MYSSNDPNSIAKCLAGPKRRTQTRVPERAFRTQGVQYLFVTPQNPADPFFAPRKQDSLHQKNVSNNFSRSSSTSSLVASVRGGTRSRSSASQISRSSSAQRSSTFFRAFRVSGRTWVVGSQQNWNVLLYFSRFKLRCLALVVTSGTTHSADWGFEATGAFGAWYCADTFFAKNKKVWWAAWLEKREISRNMPEPLFWRTKRIRVFGVDTCTLANGDKNC